MMNWVANLHDTAVGRFLQGPFPHSAPIWGWGARFGEETERSVLEVRNELRELWYVSTPAARKEEILTSWLHRGPADFLRLNGTCSRTEKGKGRQSAGIVPASKLIPPSP